MFAEFIGAQGGAGFQIANAVRLDGTSDYFSRTPGSAGNRKTWTFSCWVKNDGGASTLLSSGTGGTNYLDLVINSGGQINIANVAGGSVTAQVRTNSLLRDTIAWYHIVVAVDTPQATAADRVKLYVNGVAQTSLAVATYPTQNADLQVNAAHAHALGAYLTTPDFGGYIASPILVDGAALTPSSFGETDATTGSWKPKAISGITYGTNGFYLNFANTADLGNDVSGNGNDLALNSLSSTDATTDTPTNNFATLNALYPGRSTLSNGNLTASGATDLPTITPDSGNWYFEIGGVAKNWTPPAAFPSAAGTYNFGATAFTNSITPGYKTLCTANLPTPSIKDAGKHMDVVLYTGNGAARTITGLDFQPDFVWIKSRSAATDHALYDSARGAEKRLESNNTDVEVSTDGGLTSFDSSGFGLGTLAQVNTNAATYVAWCWKAGGAAATNTDGTISSQVSSNPTAGFAIATYTGNGNGSASFGHGLGATPKFVIIKSRGEVRNWPVYHASLTSAAYVLYLDGTDGQFAIQSFNNTAPTSTVVNIHWDAGVNNTNKSGDTFVAYCWAEISDFSKFGGFEANSSTDGTYIHLGFRARFILMKKSSATQSWYMYDTARSPYNVVSAQLYANDSAAETAAFLIDIDANGFKLRTSDSGTYIFAAFAEYPFGGQNTTPGKAR